MQTPQVFPAAGADPLEYYKLLNKQIQPITSTDTRCQRVVRRQVSPLEKFFKDTIGKPYNTKKYAFNNSVNLRTQQAELQTNKALGVFNKRRSQQADMLKTNISNFSVLKDMSTFLHEESTAAQDQNLTVKTSDGFFPARTFGKKTRSVSNAPAAPASNQLMVDGSLSPLAGKELAAQKRRGIASLVQSNMANEEMLRLMTPKTRQLHVDKITKNLPSAYEKFFFRPDDQEKIKKNEDLKCTCPATNNPKSKGLSQLPTQANQGDTMTADVNREKSLFKNSVRQGLPLQSRRLTLESSEKKPLHLMIEMNLRNRQALALERTKQKAKKLINMNSSEESISESGTILFPQYPSTAQMPQRV